MKVAVLSHCCSEYSTLMSSRDNAKTPVTGVLEGIQGMDLDPLDHEADVVRLPVQVKVCDGDDENGVDDDNADEDGR